MLSAIPLDVGPDGLLGVEQSNKTAVFSKRQQQDSHPLWEYTAVQDNKVLRLWNNEDENLDKVFKATLSAEVQRHIQHEGWTLGAIQGRGRVGLEASLAEPRQKTETVILRKQ
ncbi:hypothetical protein QTO34_013550 [Cnephaeus nilssonii]|uniref:Nucleolar protein 11 N-terminal domain-containing protein n=1 Tax=Cnephaeus nilssonii TaxID=3371016 RepID=A0AA40I8H5_CNENI|nr:hypothetical protein QTO34_013550 [Eptesicus nilssonii]